MKFSKTLTIGKDDKLINSIFENPPFYSVCISDDVVDIEFDKEKVFIQECFEKILPEKSSYEL